MEDIKEKKIHNENFPRIYYVDPNDMYGVLVDKDNGKEVPATPDYTDFCISFDLIIRKARRLWAGNTGSEDSMDEVRISYVSPSLDEVNGGNVTFDEQNINRGIEQGANENKTFLTTFYTDLDTSDLKNNGISEGLGITSIDINYDNRYCPTVKIHMVDVRGSGLFGVEEKIHNTDGSITGDNIYSAFFTMPYPEFKLQVKGFYGQAVTFQLCLVDFRGTFNSDTGNFEADATFLGYDYGLIAEIPMRYIIAAPYCEYYGKQYWNDHVNSKEWSLSGDLAPITLLDMATNISSFIDASAQGNVEEYVGSKQDSYNTDDKQNYVTSLLKVEQAFNSFWDYVTGLYPNDLQISDEKGFLCVASKNDVPSTPSVGKRDELLKAIEEHNEVYSNDIAADDYKVLKIASDGGEWTKLTYTGNEFLTPGPQGVKVVSMLTISYLFSPGYRYKLSEDKSKKIREEISKKYPGDDYEHYLRSAYFDFTSLYNNIRSKSQAAQNEIKNIKDKLMDAIKNGDIDILSIVGTRPFIGNVFKIVMCHVETFLHMMYNCVRNVYDQISGDARIAEIRNLVKQIDGKDMDTDIPESTSNNKSSQCIPPFPGVSSKKTNGKNNSDRVVGYTADLKEGSEFEETKLVNDLFDALRYVARKMDSDYQEDEVDKNNYIPIFPSECNQSSVAGIFNDKMDSVAGYLALRATEIFNVLNTSDVDFNKEYDSEEIKLLGMLEGYNYCLRHNDRNAISSSFFDKIGNEKLSDVLYDISICRKADRFASNKSNRGVSSFAFELQPMINGRQPVMIEEYEGQMDGYRYMAAKNHRPIIPERVEDYKGLIRPSIVMVNEGIVEYNSNNDNSYFTNLVNPYNYGLSNCRTYALAGSHDKWTGDGKHKWLLNRFNFEVFAGKGLDGVDYGYGEDITRHVRSAYNRLQSKVLECGSYEWNTADFSKILDKYWDIDANGYNGSFLQSSAILTTECQYDESSLYPLSSTEDLTGKNPSIVNWRDECDKKPTIDTDGSVMAGNEQIESDNAWIPDFTITDADNVGQSFKDSLFFSDFYYLQNQATPGMDTDEEKKKMDSERANTVKCLLFLHSLNYDIVKGFDRLRKTDVHNGKIKSMPYGLALLMGGVIWRYDYIKGHTTTTSAISPDPVKYRTPSAALGVSYDGYKDKTFLFNISKGIYEFGFANDPNIIERALDVPSLLDGIDGFVKNRLKVLFLDFVNSDWNTICKTCEIRKLDSGSKLFGPDGFKTLKDSLLADDVKNSPKKIFEKLKGTSFLGNYSFIKVSGDYIGLMLNRKNTSFQQLLKKVYTSEVIIADTSGYNGKDDCVKNGEYSLMTTSLYKNFLEGFSQFLNDFCGRDYDVNVDTDAERVGVDKDYDLKLSEYTMLKRLWDKWLLHDYVDTYPNNEKEKENSIGIFRGVDKYNVENYFAHNYSFVDSFYVNIFDTLKVNCDKFLTAYESSVMDNGGFVAQFLNKIANDNRCHMFGFPGYDFFSNRNRHVDDGKNIDEETMKNMYTLFKPIPYSEKNPIQTINQIVVVYVHRMSDIDSQNQEYKQDYFDIWANDKDPDNIPNTFRIQKYGENSDLRSYLDMKPYERQINAYGYDVPSFGVAYSRSNNAIFKKIGLTQNTPMVTEQVASVMQDLAEKGGSNDHRVAYYGQDVYTIYSNYSYVCDLEMLGNVQIMPLMYFQLTNVPMFRGTYMVIQVSHSMRPGSMITKVKGIKMKSSQMPFSKYWFSRINESDFFSGRTGGDGGSGSICSGESGSTEVNDNFGYTIDDVKHAGVGNENREAHWERNRANHDYDSNIAYLLNNTINPLLKEYKRQHPEYKGNGSGYYKGMFYLTSGLRLDKDTSSTSQHRLGQAVDIQVNGHMNNRELLRILLESGIEFDQAILYPEKYPFGKNVRSQWIHISNSPNKHRREVRYESDKKKPDGKKIYDLLPKDQQYIKL